MHRNRSHQGSRRKSYSNSYTDQNDGRRRHSNASYHGEDNEPKIVDSRDEQKLRKYFAEELQKEGWHDQIKFRIQEIVQEKGMECTSIEGVVREITRGGAANLVPYDVREELLDQLKRMVKKKSHSSPYY